MYNIHKLAAHTLTKTAVSTVTEKPCISIIRINQLIPLREAIAISLSEQHKTHKCPGWKKIPVFSFKASGTYRYHCHLIG